jgi:hypothetical protein
MSWPNNRLEASARSGMARGSPPRQPRVNGTRSVNGHPPFATPIYTVRTSTVKRIAVRTRSPISTSTKAGAQMMSRLSAWR